MGALRICQGISKSFIEMLILLAHPGRSDPIGDRAKMEIRVPAGLLVGRAAQEGGVPKALVGRCEQAVGEIVRSGEAQTFSFVCREQNGEREYEVAIGRQPVDAEPDRPLVAVFRPRVQRSRDRRTTADQLFHDRQARHLAEAVRAARVGYWEYALRTGRAYWCAQTQRLLGLPEDCPVRTVDLWRRAIHPDDRARVMALVSRGIPTKQRAFCMEYRVVWPDGSIHPLCDIGTHELDAQGAVVRSHGLFFEIDNCCCAGQADKNQVFRPDRRRMTENLAAPRQPDAASQAVVQRQRPSGAAGAVGSSPVVVFEQDRELRVTWAYNWQNTLPSIQSVIGRDDRQILGPAGAAVTMPIKYGVMATGIGVRRDITLPLRNGLRAFDLTVDPRIGSDGRIEGVICAAVDVTEARRSERALAEAKAEAERVSAAKSRFLAATTHDLRQPLQAQALFCDMLADRNRDPALVPVISSLAKAIQAQEDLLEGMLDITRLEAGVVVPAIKTFPVSQIILGMFHEFHLQAEEKGLQLRCVAGTGTLSCDPVLLKRILRNLISNAIKYTRQGGVLIGSRCRGQTVSIQVWDTGIGIPDAHQRAVFEEYFQIGESALDQRFGLGLGLAIVDRLARLLGCRIRMRSQPGRGSMFEIEGLLRGAAVVPGSAVTAGPAAGS